MCDYVYLGYDEDLEYGDRLPREPNRFFASGEFSRLFQIVRYSFLLYFRDGIDWQAAAYSFQNIAANGALLDIQEISKKKNGVIIRIYLLENADRAEVKRDFWKYYEVAQKTFEGERRNADRLIASQEKQIVRYEGEINRLLTMLDNTRTITINAANIHGTGYTEGDNTTNTDN